jgi:UDP-N-acetylmuramate--alanine ligase
MNYTGIISLDQKQPIHFVGIGGAGMSGIAEVLLTKGHPISGSDMHESEVTLRLRNLGAQVHIGHSAANINGAAVVVLSSAVKADNPEVIRAQEKNLPILPRAKMLALLMHAYKSIVVAGTHGKTTTTSLIASVLAEAKMDPTFVIGGLLKSAGCNAQLGDSAYFVAEADESDASFLFLQPEVAVVTNIDEDHLSTYGGDFNRLKDAFLEFLGKVPEQGAKVLCGDDPVIKELLPQLSGKIMTYGFGAGNTIRAENYEQHNLVAKFLLHDTVLGEQFEVELAIPGLHNVLNALATYAVARHYDIDAQKTLSALAKFQGVGRRFQLYDDIKIPQGSFSLIDDYGHHPRELQVTIDAVRKVWPERRLVMVFQPHRYSRTVELMGDFVEVLSAVDLLVLLEIYPAGEAPLPGVSGAVLATRFSNESTVPLIFVPRMENLLAELGRVVQNGDVVLIQGAGDIGKMAPKIATHPEQLMS